MLKNIKNICILVAICSVMAILLALTNQVTAPLIEQHQNAAANEAFEELFPGGKFEAIDLSKYDKIPPSVAEAYRETSGQGYVLKMVYASAYQPGDTILMCGVNADGTIKKIQFISTTDDRKTEAQNYGDSFVGKDINTYNEVDTIAKATYTTAAYKDAIKDAINAAALFGGADVDTRTEEEKFNDNLKNALPAGEGKFTKVFLTEVVEGVDAVYAADNGKGYVCVAVKEAIGEDFTGEFIGIDSDLNIVTAGSTVNTGAAYDAVKAIKASTSEDITATFQTTIKDLMNNAADRAQIAAYRNLQKNITSVKKTATGNYVMEVKGEGYGIKGEYHSSGEYILIRVAITADGKMIDCYTISQSESEKVGDVCATEDFTTRFDGKTEADLDEVDGVAGATITFTGYKEALRRCLTAVTILEGGAE